MSNKYSRHKSIINREADSHIDEDHWLKQFEKNLHKSAVQPRKVDQSLFEQINGIMNNKSKYTSVSAAVEDMMHRSGLTGYLENINKVSKDESNHTKKASEEVGEDIDDEVSILLKKAKIVLNSSDDSKWHDLGKIIGQIDHIKDDVKPAIDSIKKLQESKDETFNELKIPFEHWDSYTSGYAKGAELSDFAKESDKQKTKEYLQSSSLKTALHKHDFLKKKTEVIIPIIFKKVPTIKKTLENYIQDTKGNLPIPAILDKIRSIHAKDVSDARDWEDENLLTYISKERLKHQINNTADKDNINLGRQDTTITDLNDSNTDMFSGLMPAKI